MPKAPDEWLKQADYDMGAAKAMYNSHRYIYAVFMCHLSIEKTLKGIYQKDIGEPPRVHSLVFFVEKLKLELPKDLYDFIFSLNQASVPTRYPEDLEKMTSVYNKEKTNEIMKNTRRALKWITEKY